MKPITVGNDTYTSSASAWRALSPDGLPQITVRWRLNNGWDALEAFTELPVPPIQRRTFKGVRSI